MTAGPRRIPDALLTGLLVPLWVVALALHVHSAATGRLAWPGVFVDSPGPHADPVVESVRQGTLAAEHGLLPGDQLTAAGGTPLRGIGPIGWFALALARADDRLEVDVDFVRDGTPGRATLRLSPVAMPWRSVPLAVTFVVTAYLVMRRRPGTAVARAFFLAAMALSLHWMFFFGRWPAITRVWVVYQGLTGLVLFPLVLRPVLLFPEEIAPPNGRLPWWPWAFAAFGPVATSWAVGVPFPARFGLLSAFVLNLTFLAVLLGLLTRNYRRASAGGKRKLRWVVFGFYVGTAPLVAANVVSVLVPRLWWLHEVAATAMILLPICVVIAIVRDNLLDVDRLISATTAYSILSVLLLFLILTAVPWLAERATAAWGTNLTGVQTALSLTLAAALVPGQRALQPWIDRVFFAERHALEAGFATLLEDLGRAATPDALLRLLGERLDVLLAPTGLTIHAGLGRELEIVLARGAVASWPSRITVPQASPSTAGGPADAATPASTRSPLVLDDPRLASPASLAAVGPNTAADLRACGVQTLLTVTRGARLAGLVSLGAKRSGDSLVPSERALLAAVAEKVSDALARFDESEILRQERAMGEGLRRYVPTPVADRLARGNAIEGGERDLSVLFVDVRGYTALSAERGAGDVFSIINQYTQVVAECIRRHGGTVVEFLGDGLMAVFGAPEKLADHAAAAVAAARGILVAVADLAVPAATEGAAPANDPTTAGVALSVGIGIATGPAFVGNVETGDRLVFTALGDTVNLASRLQGLTRELGVAVAVDQRTREEAGETASDFDSRGAVAIRGRPAPAAVWTLSLQGAHAEPAGVRASEV